MRIRSFPQIINIALRGATLGSKFLLIFFLARFLEPAELGVYGLLAAGISYSLFLLGFDFYTYSTRELLKNERDQWGRYLKAQMSLFFILYAIFLPLLGLLFIKEVLPLYIAGWFYTLLVLEHLTQEIGRLLVVVSEQLYASLILFLRSGIWGVAVTILMSLDPEARSLNVLLGGWTIGSMAALGLGIYRIKRMGLSGWIEKVDWAWVAKGVKIASALLVATLAIRGIFTLDRYWFEYLLGLDVLGAYVLFMGICSALTSFLEAGVFSFIYPGLVASFQSQDALSFRRGVRKLLVQTLSFTALFVFMALLLIEPLLSWLDKPLYSDQLYLFPWLLIATSFYSIGMVPHFALYAQGRDRAIIFSHIGGLLMFIATTWLVSLYWVKFAVPIGLCASFLFILCWKFWSYVRMTSAQYRFSSPDAVR